MNSFEHLVDEYQQTLQDCQELYADAGADCVQQYPDLVDRDPVQFIQMMNDLHRGLLIKIYTTICDADRRWSDPEKELASRLIQHVWDKKLSGPELRKAARRMFDDADKLTWYSLLRPFDTLYPLREKVAQLETIVMRNANLVAKCDSHVTPAEKKSLREIESNVGQLLHQTDLGSPAGGSERNVQAAQAVQRDARKVQADQQLPAAGHVVVHAADGNQLEQSLSELDALIALDEIKSQIRSLSNFLRIQQERTRRGLPTTDLALHMVFLGNPGTGKTTVARLIGRILAALGVLEKGHLVETDRSGLVAEYAGQSGPKTNRRVDESLDGVLFIDEAYSLIHHHQDDSFGREAVLALLKRMEDDRKRLVVILAGYPQPMQQLLESNPGLKSRFGTLLNFPDYDPVTLGRIFEHMCKASHYQLPAATRARLLLGFDYLYRCRDQSFGNGRLARNIFEHSIRHMANRLIEIAPLTHDLLTTLQPEDVLLEGVPEEVLDRSDTLVVRVACDHCREQHRMEARYLGRSVTCPQCNQPFPAAWGKVAGTLRVP